MPNKKKKDEEEECHPCKLRVGAFMALGICDMVVEEDGEDQTICDDLSEKFEAGKISAKAVLKKVRDKVKNKPKAKAELEDLEKLMKE